MFRNYTCYVTTRRVSEPLPGRPLLYALGLKDREIMAAASAHHDGDVNVGNMLLGADEYAGGSVARVLADQVIFYHLGQLLTHKRPEAFFGAGNRHEE